MKYLLDTNVFLWFIHGDDELTNDFKFIIEDNNNEIYLSQASVWEIAIKYSIGKLKLKRKFDDLIPGLVEEKGFIILPINNNQIKKMITLPFIHKDPFDRLIYAAAKTENIEFLYTDEIFDEYEKIYGLKK